MSMWRWAKPHRGPPDHLTDREYTVRTTVFMVLYAVTLLPLIIFGIMLVFMGPLVGVFLFNITNVIRGFGTWDPEVQLWYGSFALICCICAPTALWIRYRFLVSKTPKAKRYVVVEVD